MGEGLDHLHIFLSVRRNVAGVLAMGYYPTDPENDVPVNEAVVGTSGNVPRQRQYLEDGFLLVGLTGFSSSFRVVFMHNSDFSSAVNVEPKRMCFHLHLCRYIKHSKSRDVANFTEIAQNPDICQLSKCGTQKDVSFLKCTTLKFARCIEQT